MQETSSSLFCTWHPAAEKDQTRLQRVLPAHPAPGVAGTHPLVTADTRLTHNLVSSDFTLPGGREGGCEVLFKASLFYQKPL